MERKSCRKCGKRLKDLFGVRVTPLGLECHSCAHPQTMSEEQKELIQKAIWYNGLIAINQGRGKEYIDALHEAMA